MRTLPTGREFRRVRPGGDFRPQIVQTTPRIGLLARGAVGRLSAASRSPVGGRPRRHSPISTTDRLGHSTLRLPHELVASLPRTESPKQNTRARIQEGAATPPEGTAAVPGTPRATPRAGAGDVGRWRRRYLLGECAQLERRRLARPER